MTYWADTPLTDEWKRLTTDVMGLGDTPIKISARMHHGLIELSDYGDTYVRLIDDGCDDPNDILVEALNAFGYGFTFPLEEIHWTSEEKTDPHKAMVRFARILAAIPYVDILDWYEDEFMTPDSVKKQNSERKSDQA
jgi:hypothetical protein